MIRKSCDIVGVRSSWGDRKIGKRGYLFCTRKENERKYEEKNDYCSFHEGTLEPSDTRYDGRKKHDSDSDQTECWESPCLENEQSTEHTDDACCSGEKTTDFGCVMSMLFMTSGFHDFFHFTIKSWWWMLRVNVCLDKIRGVSFDRIGSDPDNLQFS